MYWATSIRFTWQEYVLWCDSFLVLEGESWDVRRLPKRISAGFSHIGRQIMNSTYTCTKSWKCVCVCLWMYEIMKICFRQLNKMITCQYFLTSVQMKPAQHIVNIFWCGYISVQLFSGRWRLCVKRDCTGFWKLCVLIGGNSSVSPHPT